ncbi:MAG TPA: hypothetical protein PK674_00115 [Candidatus Absconditabacterales bacterium]|nr:hypothetical protein [Candidatus Absconditabacterales bacterium]HOQ78895.1 hypothetical protein [Candidatus Absconditabacterales bacterium]HPK27786.1 hypothetical protein [Candidatus Absconditabacterales bacterium]
MDILQLGGLENLYTAIVALFVFLRIISIIWVAKDISARTNSLLLQISSIVLITFFTPIIGIPLYHIIKPIGYKKDKMPWREACVSNSTICINCGTINAKEHKCCIYCGKKLTIKCKECNMEYPHNYRYCPKCGGPNIELK